MVTPQNPFKVDEKLLDNRIRFEMVQRALKDDTRLIASDYEFHLPQPSYTWRTLEALHRDFPQRSFVLLIGADNWLSFDRWAEPQKILNACKIVIYPREGFPIDSASLPRGVRLLDVPTIPISSTDIRQRVHEGEPIEGLVPKPVEKMIDELGLYR